MGHTSTTGSDPVAAKRGHYCFCPTGFTGIYCDMKFVLCQDETELCFNSEPCLRDMDDEGKEYFHCECDTDPAYSHLETREAGRFCEQSPSKTKCQGGDDFYCSNSGKCNRDNKSCTCPGAWTGEHCEIPVNLQDLYESSHFMDDDVPEPSVQQPETKTSDEKQHVAYMSLIIILGTVVAVLIVSRHYGAEVRYGRVQLRTDEPPPLSGPRPKRRPHPMEMEMKHMSKTPQAN